MLTCRPVSRKRSVRNPSEYGVARPLNTRTELISITQTDRLGYYILTSRSPSLEARCIIIQISVAAKDPKMAHGLIHDFWTKPNVDATLPFTLFMEKLIYTYKDWGSNPHVFDIFFQVLVQVGILDGAKKLFYKMLNYGVVISVDSCNLYLSQLSKNTDRCKATSRIFSEFFKEGVKWNTMSHEKTIRITSFVEWESERGS
ncbi:hypothetical protein Tco_0328267 [Tanacetum coccineum]